MKRPAQRSFRITVQATFNAPITNAQARATLAASLALYGLPAPSSFPTCEILMQNEILKVSYWSQPFVTFKGNRQGQVGFDEVEECHEIGNNKIDHT